MQFCKTFFESKNTNYLLVSQQPLRSKQICALLLSIQRSRLIKAGICNNVECCEADIMSRYHHSCSVSSSWVCLYISNHERRREWRKRHYFLELTRLQTFLKSLFRSQPFRHPFQGLRELLGVCEVSPRLPIR